MMKKVCNTPPILHRDQFVARNRLVLNYAKNRFVDYRISVEEMETGAEVLGFEGEKPYISLVGRSSGNRVEGPAASHLTSKKNTRSVSYWWGPLGWTILWEKCGKKSTLELLRNVDDRQQFPTIRNIVCGSAPAYTCFAKLNPACSAQRRRIPRCFSPGSMLHFSLVLDKSTSPHFGPRQ